MNTNTQALREALEACGKFMNEVRYFAQNMPPINEYETTGGKPLHWKAREIQDLVIAALPQPPAPEQASGERKECRYPRCACVVDLNGSWKGCAATPTAEPAVEAVAQIIESAAEQLKTCARTWGAPSKAAAAHCDLLAKELLGLLSASPAAPEAAKPAYTTALEIRTAQGWKLTGEAIPVLYTDTINDQQVMRDDVWLCTTEALRKSGAAKPEQQAQAGEPLEEWLCREMPTGTVIGDQKWWAPRIARVALQSHREAMQVEADRVSGLRAELALAKAALLAIPGKDAALQACMEALDELFYSNSTGVAVSKYKAAITQAQEARK